MGLVVLFASAFPVATAVGIREVPVTFQNEGMTLRGILTYPESLYPERPAILLLHGFMGQKNEAPIIGINECMFERTARKLSEAGYITLRFDFRGSGESEGKLEDTTFTGQISDTLAAIEFMRKNQHVNPKKIGLIGLSQGGLVAACAAAKAHVGSVVLWSPLADPAYTCLQTMGSDVIEAAYEAGSVTFMMPWGVECMLKRSYFEEIFTVFPLVEISKFSGPLLVIVGENDALVSPQPEWGYAYLIAHTGVEESHVLHADHLFDVLSGEGPADLDDVIGASIRWFDTSLVRAQAP